MKNQESGHLPSPRYFAATWRRGREIPALDGDFSAESVFLCTVLLLPPGVVSGDFAFAAGCIFGDLIVGDFDLIGDFGDFDLIRQAAVCGAVLARRGRGMYSRRRSERGDNPPGIAAFCARKSQIRSVIRQKILTTKPSTSQNLLKAGARSASTSSSCTGTCRAAINFKIKNSE